MFNPKRLNQIVTTCIAISLGIAAGMVSYTQVLSVPDQAVSNWYYDHAAVKSVDNRITIVALDSPSTYGETHKRTWDTEELADAIDTLSAHNAAVIGLDLNLSQATTDTQDTDHLVAACEAAGNVVAIANAQFEESDSKPPATPSNEATVVNISYPADELLESVDVGIGNTTSHSSDGFIRNAAITLEYDGTEFESFAVRIYKTFKDYLGEDYVLPELDENEFFAFNTLNGQINCNIIRFSDLLNNTYDTSLIEGNIVLVGEYIENTNSVIERIVTPMQQQQDILVQASIIQSLLNQQTIQHVSPLFQANCYAVLITVCYLIISSRKIWVTILSSIALSQGVIGFGFLTNASGYRFQLLVPILFFIITFIVALIQRYIVSLVERKKMELTLKMYVEPQIVDQLSEKAPFEFSSLSERRQIAVLFVDIRGFTTISESLEPEQVVEILNEYLTVVAKAIHHWGGTLDKFIGDAAMAFFNAPSDQDDYIYRTVCAAYEIAENGSYLQKKYEEQYGKPVTFGIGINCGNAIVGNIGSVNRMDYTAIGDTVNVASRLEGKAKAGQILISKSVYDALKDRIEASYIDSFTLKGKTKTVETYQLDHIPDFVNSKKRKFNFLTEVFK